MLYYTINAAAARSRATASSRPISGSSAAISGPLSRPVSARRSGWNSALPLRRSALSRATSCGQGALAPVDLAGRLAPRRRESRDPPPPPRARHGRGGSPTSPPPRRQSRRLGRIAAQSAALIPAGSRVADRFERQLVDDPRVQRRQLLHVEPRRRPAEGGEIEARRSAAPASATGSTGRLVPIRASFASNAIGSIPASRIASTPSEPSRLESLPSDADQQRLMGEGRRRRAQRLEHLDLQRRYW